MGNKTHSREKLVINKGDKFGRLTIIKEVEPKYKDRKRCFECECECGDIRNYILIDLTRGHTRSCGCIRIKHGMCFTSTYTIWVLMRRRCESDYDTEFHNYGGRGVKYTERWKKFENFLEDMGVRPEGLQIDRIDNDGDYCKENCKWSTPKEQSNNKRNNVHLTYKGEKLNITQWAEKTGINKNTLTNRMKSNWTIEEALTIKPSYANNTDTRRKS